MPDEKDSADLINSVPQHELIGAQDTLAMAQDSENSGPTSRRVVESETDAGLSAKSNDVWLRLGTDRVRGGLDISAVNPLPEPGSINGSSTEDTGPRSNGTEDLVNPLPGSLADNGSSTEDLVPLPKEPEDLVDVFPLKPMKFFDPLTESYKTVKVLGQNTFGPCAALALCNTLILRSELTLEGELVSFDTLIALLGDLLLKRVEGKGVESSPVEHVADVLSTLPSLRHGLDIDVFFDDINGFEDSPALSVFKVFGVDLYHGWTIDPQDEASYTVLVQVAGSYNRAVELLIEAETVDKAAGESSTRDLVETIHNGEVVRNFLNNTPSQLTAHGLTQLSEQLQPFSLAILFRHNHFATLYKQNELYTLITDVGYVNSGATWESLNNFDGDTQLVDEFFTPYVQSGHTPVASETQLDQFAGVPDVDADADLALAMSLQEEENQAEAAPPRQVPSQRSEAATAQAVPASSEPSNIDQRLRQATGASRPTQSQTGSEPGRGQSTGSAAPAARQAPAKKKKDESSCSVM